MEYNTQAPDLVTLGRLKALLSKATESNERLDQSINSLLSENGRLRNLLLSYRIDHGENCECGICEDARRLLDRTL